MRKEYKLIVGISLIAVLIGAYLSLSNGTTGNAQQIDNNPNSFAGKILGAAPPQETLSGLTVLSDQGCTIDPRTQLSNCTSAIQTSGGVIYFNYEHNMMIKPCLSQGDVVSLVINRDGSAVATRTYWTGKGGA